MAEIALEQTKSSEIAHALVKARSMAGSPAMDMSLTFLVVTDDENVADAMQTSAKVAGEHPARVIGIIHGDGRGAPRLDAKVRVGENAAGESLLLRLSGPLVKHADSVVLPLLLPDSPVVVWWPGKPPTNPAEDPIGRLAQRRLTDAEAVGSPDRTLKSVAAHYTPGDTDLVWTRLTPWRALLAAALDQTPGDILAGRVEAGSSNAAATLLVAWLESRLQVSITRARGPEERITRVVLRTENGEVTVERLDAESVRFSVPRTAPVIVPLLRRPVAELLAEDLRRLDPDEIYAATIAHLLESR